jgi:hypothetical protein
MKNSSIRKLLSIVATHDYELEQLDVKTAFFTWGVRRGYLYGPT